jgi:tape measure domain-containing protein
MRNVIEYIIRAKDATATGLKSAVGGIKSFASKVGTNLANIKAGFDMVRNVVSSFASVVGSAIKEAFKFESAQANFKTLLGSAEEAKQHIAELREFASSTPLTFDDLAGASKQLLSFGISVNDVVPSLKMLGDISLGNSEKFKGLALVFAQVKSAGKLMGQDLLQMINQGFNPLTIIAQETGKSMSELKDMVSDGAISFEMVEAAMRSATSAGGLFNNAMAESSKTGEGMMSTLKDKWADAVRTFGNAFSDAAKGGIQKLIDKLTELINDGTIDVWAAKAAKAFQSLSDKIEAVVKGASAVWSALKWVYEKSGASDAVHAVEGVVKGAAAAAGTLAGGGSLSDAGKAWDTEAAKTVGKGYYGRGFARAGVFGEDAKKEAEALDAKEAAEEKELKAVKEAAIERQRAARAEKAAAQATADANSTTKQKSIKEMMAEAEAKKAEEVAKKAAEAKAKEEEKLRAKELQERRQMEQKIHAEKVKLLTEELNVKQATEQDANARLEAAKAKSAQAWGWYRDKDSLKAQIEEEKANAQAEEQFAKDFEKLKFRRDWRTADNLSLDEEAVRRVGVAREEEQAAREYAQQTAENTRRAADALEELNKAALDGGDL